MKGIDVSVWNGSNDFDRAKADGVDFVIIRSNFGYSNNFKNKGYDSYFEENYIRVKEAGLPVGVYCYNYAQTVEQAKQEAYRTLNCIKGKSIDIAVFCDAEDKYFAQGDNVTDKIIAYLKIIKEAGYKVGVYANLNWFTNYINLDRIKSELGEVFTWIAHYNKSIFKNNPNHYKDSYDIWQYGSEGHYADGITNYGGGIGYVDTNISYIDFKENSESEEDEVKDISIRKLIVTDRAIDSLPHFCEDRNNVGNTVKFIGFIVTLTKKWQNYYYSQFLNGWVHESAFEDIITCNFKAKVKNKGFSVDTLAWTKRDNKYYKHITSSDELLGKEFTITAKTTETGGYYYIHELAKWIDYRAFTLPVTDVAKEVLQGKWGNGTERKEKLTAAGYDYAEVQKEVNKLV